MDESHDFFCFPDNENDPLVCIETEDGFMEWLPLSQLLKSRQQSLAVPTSDAQQDTDLVPYMEQQCLVREKSALQSQNKELQSRLEYISRCYNEQSDAFAKREQELETQNKALQVQLDGACVARDSLRCELDGMKKKFSPRNLFARSFALLLCVAFLTGIICFNSGKKSGYDSGYQTGNEEGLTAGYDSGYDEGEKSGYGDGYDDGKIAGERQGLSRGRSEGYRDGYSDGQRVAAVPSIRSGTGTGSSRQSAIASGYIGNINTGKFHTSSCSYLPNQENQIVFSSYDEAVAAGYSPCGHCL